MIRTNVSKRYRLNPRWERTSLREQETGILVIHPDLVKFITAPIVAQQENIYSNFRYFMAKTIIVPGRTSQTISIQVDNSITMWIGQCTLRAIKVWVHTVQSKSIKSVRYGCGSGQTYTLNGGAWGWDIFHAFCQTCIGELEPSD